MVRQPPVFPLSTFPLGVHPSVVIRAYLDARHFTQTAAAKRLGMSRNNLTEILAGRRNVTAASALKFGALFGTGPDYWMQAQAAHDLERTRRRLLRPAADLTAVKKP